MSIPFGVLFHTGNYNNGLREAILDLKLNGNQSRLKPFTMRLQEKITSTQELNAADVIVLVPPYNKARPSIVSLLARSLSKKVRISVEVDSLYFNGKLSRKERLGKGTFSIRKPESFLNKRIILLDDIYRTGATAKECREALLKAGAMKVFVLVIAKMEKGVHKMAKQFIGHLDKKKNKDGGEWFSGNIGQIPVTAIWRKNKPDKLDISLDAKSIAWRAEQPVPKSGDKPPEGLGEL